MDIIVHGTKGGSKIFTTKKISGLLDVSSDTSKATAIGQQAYGIRFMSDNTIFSKYKIIRDVRGDKRTGFVCFSLPIPNNKKLSGSDIIAVLDNVSEEYCQQYIVDNNLNEVTEDWNFLDRILREYDAKLRNVSPEDAKAMQSGDKDDTFIYFKDASELQKYFEDPFHEEYAPYRQVLFIISDLQDKPENPLNALRHSENDLTGKIDLENPPYRLREFHGSGKNGVEIKIKNSRGRELDNNDKVYRKEQLTLVYSKKYYHEKKFEGSLLNNEELRKYLVVNSDNSIDVVKEIELNPETKTITLVVKDHKGGVIDNAVITCISNNYPYTKPGINNKIVFSDVELKEHWLVIVRNGNFSGEKKIIPENENENESVEIEVNWRIIIPINVEDESNNKLSNFEVWTTLTKGYQRRNTIEFVDEQINGFYTVTIRKKGYEEENIKNFNPNRRKSIDITLKEQKNIPTPGGPAPIGQEPGKRKSFAAKAKKIFFSKPAFIAGSIIVILILGFGIRELSSSSGKKENNEASLNKSKIQIYVEGDVLNLDTLNDYKSQWKEEENDFIKKSGGGLFGGEEKADSARWKSDWNPAFERIEQAIRKRNLINDKNFTELKNLHYSNFQKSYQKAIEKIDSTKYAEVSNQLGDVSALTLKQIEEKINKILKPKEPAKEETSYEQNMEEKKQEQKNEPSTITEQPKEQPKPQAQPAPNDKTSEIIQYIKGSKLKKEILQQYQKDTGKNTTLKASINLCLKLWSLNGKLNNSYSSYQKELNNDINLKNSELKNFVDEMSSKEQPKYVIELPKSDQKKSLSEIQIKMQ